MHARMLFTPPGREFVSWAKDGGVTELLHDTVERQLFILSDVHSDVGASAGAGAGGEARKGFRWNAQKRPIQIISAGFDVSGGGEAAFLLRRIADRGYTQDGRG